MKRRKNVVWQSADSRVTSDYCQRDRSVTFFKKISNCLKHPKTLFDSRPMVAWPPTTVAWPFSDFFQKFFQLLDSSENSCLAVGWRSRHLRLGWNVEKMLFESQRTVTWRSGYFVPVVFFFVRLHILPRRCISRLIWFEVEDLWGDESQQMEMFNNRMRLRICGVPSHKYFSKQCEGWCCNISTYSSCSGPFSGQSDSNFPTITKDLDNQP